MARVTVFGIGVLVALAGLPAYAQEEAADAGAPPRRPLSRPVSEGEAAPYEPLVIPTIPRAPEPPTDADAETVATEDEAVLPSRHVHGLYGFGAFVNAVGLGTFVSSQYDSFAFGSLRLQPGYGFEVKGVKLDATADWALGVEYTLPDNAFGSRFSWTNMQLWLSAPELVRVPHSGLSLTPGFGVTVPLSFHGGGSLLTELKTGARLELRHGGLELGYRIVASRAFIVGGGNAIGPSSSPVFYERLPEWTLSNSLISEFHASARLSFGSRLRLVNAWYLPISLPRDPFTPNDGLGPGPIGTTQRDSLGQLLFASFAFTSWLGLTAGISRDAPLVSRSTGLVRLVFLDNNTILFLSLWGRSSPALSPEWMLW